MANFGVEQTQVGEARNFVSPQDPVERPISAAPGILEDVFSGVETLIKSKKEDKSAKVLSAFQREQLTILDAADQGRIKRGAARTKLRANLINYLNTNELLHDDLVKANAAILGTAGMGSFVTEKDQKQVEDERIDNTMLDMGLITSNSTQEERAAARSDFATVQRAKAQYDAKMNSLNLRKTQLSLSSAERDEIKELESEASVDYITDLGRAEIRRVDNTVTEIRKRIQSGEITEAQGLQELDQLQIQFNEGIAPHEARITGHQADALRKPFELTLSAAQKLISGEYEQGEYDREIKRRTSLYQSLLLKNDKWAGYVAVSELFPNLPIDQLTQINVELSEFFSTNFDESNNLVANPFRDDPTGRKASREYMEAIGTELDAASPEALKEQGVHLSAILEGVVDYEGVVRKNPKAGIELMNFFSSQKFLKLMQKHPAAVKDIDTVKDILQTNYADEVWGMVKREFKESGVWEGGPIGPGGEGADRVPTDKVVGYRPSDDGVEFYALDSGNRNAVAKAKRLNKELRPIINTTVKATAHLSGRTDYKQVFSEAAENIFNPTSLSTKSAPAGGDEGDDFDLSDFSFPKVSQGGLPASVRSDEDFLSRVEELSHKLEIDPAALLSVMDFETGGSFNPAQKNAAGSSGTGLIQFMANTARGLGTSVQELAQMSRAEQMDYVEKYFSQFGDKIRGGSVEDVYMAVLFPKAIDKDGDYTLFRKGTLAYTQNKGLDKNGDGTVTKAEAASKVVSLVGKHSWS